MHKKELFLETQLLNIIPWSALCPFSSLMRVHSTNEAHPVKWIAFLFGSQEFLLLVDNCPELLPLGATERKWVWREQGSNSQRDLSGMPETLNETLPQLQSQQGKKSMGLVPLNEQWLLNRLIDRHFHGAYMCTHIFTNRVTSWRFFRVCVLIIRYNVQQ